MNSGEDKITHPRRVRSFVRRAGRVTAGQQRALRELWPRWGLDEVSDELDLDAIFGRQAPRVVEIGFGDGESLVAMAAANPELDFVGIEVHEPGVGHCLLQLDAANLSNLRLIRHDAIEVLAGWLPAQSIDRVQLFFPDPWPKKRHHKRRIVQPGFIALLRRILKPGGVMQVATDWANYAEHIEDVMRQETDFERIAIDSGRLETKFERRGQRLGHDIVDLSYRLASAVR
ncbi:MAG: tRNA (guanosine(46)-N7)-methyltransferase TrmB [Gammaproteobacteria bacterium]|nr:tRNA (guanosine(46)-N7)-methyltransferase TrmB [Gammaproteobacteria bacterium]